MNIAGSDSLRLLFNNRLKRKDMNNLTIKELERIVNICNLSASQLSTMLSFFCNEKVGANRMSEKAYNKIEGIIDAIRYAESECRDICQKAFKKINTPKTYTRYYLYKYQYPQPVLVGEYESYNEAHTVMEKCMASGCDFYRIIEHKNISLDI